MDGKEYFLMDRTIYQYGSECYVRPIVRRSICLVINVVIRYLLLGMMIVRIIVAVVVMGGL